MSQSTLAQFLEQIQAEIRAIHQRLDRVEAALATQSLQQMAAAGGQAAPAQFAPPPVSKAATTERPAATRQTSVAADDWLKSKLNVADQSPLMKKLLSSLEGKVNRYSFYTWFKDIQIASDEGDKITISVPDALAADWLRRRYGKLLEEALNEAGRTGVNVEIVSRPDA